METSQNEDTPAGVVRTNTKMGGYQGGNFEPTHRLIRNATMKSFEKQNCKDFIKLIGYRTLVKAAVCS